MAHSERFTSTEAAQISGVPFFTVDYWHRSKFLQATVAQGDGRGRGRNRLYSYGDILRLRIARELRDQQVSLETLHRVVMKLAPLTGRLAKARYVVVGRAVALAASPEGLVELLDKRGRGTFAILLDLSRISPQVEERATKVLAARRTPASRA